MAAPHDDLDLTQAQAFALQPAELAELLATVEQSLRATCLRLQACTEEDELHRSLHDLKGYLGLVTGPALCEWVQRADRLARQGRLEDARAELAGILPRLQSLESAVGRHRTGIIAG